MAWFEFDQNNTGGSFEVNDMVCHRVLIEASDAKEANRIAVDMGIYFDGCATGMDCNCCGDRWSEASGEGMTFPYTYSKDMIFNTPELYMQYLVDNHGWTTPEARIYYADGRRVSEIMRPEKRKATK